MTILCLKYGGISEVITEWMYSEESNFSDDETEVLIAYARKMYPNLEITRLSTRKNGFRILPSRD